MKLTQGWFAHPSDTPKSVQTLMGNHAQTIGRNAVLLLNVPPTTTGAFAEQSVQTIKEFAAERRRRFTNDVARGRPAVVSQGTTTRQLASVSTTALTDDNSRSGWAAPNADAGSATIEFASTQPISSIWLSEDTLHHGQVIEDALVEARVDGTWQQIGTVGSVGVNRLVQPSATVRADAIRVQVRKARGPWSLASVRACTILGQDPGLLHEVFVDPSAPVAGDGSKDHPFNSLEQFRQAELAPGAKVHLAGGDYPASTTPFWGFGTSDQPIIVDQWGQGGAVTTDGRAMAERMAHLEAQGWVIKLPADDPAPTDPAPTDPASSQTPSASGTPGTPSPSAPELSAPEPSDSQATSPGTGQLPNTGR